MDLIPDWDEVRGSNPRAPTRKAFCSNELRKAFCIERWGGGWSMLGINVGKAKKTADSAVQCHKSTATYTRRDRDIPGIHIRI